jgi:flagellar basal body-associated protein FliL
MVDKPDDDDGAEDDNAEGEGQASGERSTFFSSRRVVCTVIITLVVQSLGMAYYILQTKQAPVGLEAEVDLGDYQFNGNQIVSRIEFTLHVSLLGGLDRQGRHLLRTHQHRVQQEIEQLLRQAHEGDFEDPVLAELKRQIQETINQTLGKNVISEVIVTSLELERIAQEPVSHAVERTGPPTVDWEEEAEEVAS